MRGRRESAAVLNRLKLYLGRWAARTSSDLDDSLVELIGSTNGFVLLVIGLHRERGAQFVDFIIPYSLPPKISHEIVFCATTVSSLLNPLDAHRPA
jgi:hypothetical protein